LLLGRINGKITPMKKLITAVIAAIVPAILIATTIHFLKTPLDRELGMISNQGLTTSKIDEASNKLVILKKFFEKNKSPLANHAAKFIEISTKYNIDYRLLPAISCTESSCGKFLIPSSHNPFGWGIYGNKVTSFESYDIAIETVAQGISKHYISRGFDTPEKIGHIYNPNTPLAWAGHTRFFMNQMDKIAFELN